MKEIRGIIESYLDEYTTIKKAIEKHRQFMCLGIELVDKWQLRFWLNIEFRIPEYIKCNTRVIVFYHL